VIRTASRVTKSNFVAFAVITVLVQLPVNLVLEWVPLPDEPTLQDLARYFRILRALEFWIGTVGALAVIHLAVAACRGGRLSLGEALGRAFRGYGSALWARFLYNLALLVGILLLVVPGILVAVYGLFALQAIATRGLGGREALRYSYEAVRGRWWPYFGRIVALYGLLLAATAAIAIPASFLPASLAVNLVSAVPVDLLWSFFTVCLTVLFLESEPKTLEERFPELEEF